MPRGIRAVGWKRRVFSNADIFVGRDRGRFGFRTGVGKKPAGKSTGETTWDVSAGRSGCRDGSAQVAGRTRCCVTEIGLRLVNFRLGHWRRRRSCGLATILGERLAGKKNGFFRDSAGCGGTGSFRWAVIKAALCWSTRFETARCAAAIFRASLVPTTVVVTTRIVSARLAALRRSIFGGRQIAAAHVWALRAPSATLTSATAAPASATATVAATVTTTISAAAVILAATVAATASRARRVVLSGIVMGWKILRSGSIWIGLTLLRVMSFVAHFGSVGTESFVGAGLVFYDAGLLVVREGIVMRRFVIGWFVRGFFGVSFVSVLFFMLVRGSGVAERFTREQFDNVGWSRRKRRRRCGCILVRMAVIVVLEIFENVADVKESIAIEADVNESGLHAGEDAGDSAFVDTANEGELFFALDVNFD
jgi:hypothetical protein